MAMVGQEKASIYRIAWWPFLVTVAFAQAASCADPSAQTTLTNAQPAVDGCTAKAVETGGRRQLALLVGVGKYLGPDIRQLTGPANDLARMRTLLVEQYGFPETNVCTLVDEQATTAAFKSAFDKTLVERTREGMGDVAVLFIAAHGSQVLDTNKDEDEEDGLDETILFHDSRVGNVKDLVDDELNAMLARLYARTHNVVLILDSCNSGTASRGPSASTFTARYVSPADGLKTPPPVGSSGGLGDPWLPADMTEAVFLSAATDGTSALETGGFGVFTNALIDVLGKVGPVPLSYSQAARRIPVLVQATGSPQIPLFQGNLDREVFGTAGRPRPLAWEVKKAGEVIELSGPLTPGMGPGAELRLFAPSANRADYSDPAKAKATLVVDSGTGLNVKAHIAAASARAEPPREGDFGILVRPSDEAIKISVRLRPSAELGGIPATRAQAVRSAVAADRDASVAVTLTEGPADFELSVSPAGSLVLRDPEDKVRNTYPSDAGIAESLWQHARQKALRFIQAEGGSDFDEQTLQVRLVPAATQQPCGQTRLRDWVQSAPAAEQVVPLCVSFQIEVHHVANSPATLLIGGVILSSDGSTIGFPDGDAIPLAPGRTHIFKAAYFGAPPLDTQDFVRVFGTQQSNRVRWDLLTREFQTRSVGAPTTALHRALDRYLTPGLRGVGRAKGPIEDTTWAASGVAMRVEANPRFTAVQADAPAAKFASREYTIPYFDIRPHMPDDPNTALYKVLRVADDLARTQVSYKQHPWTEPTDAANLARGIDCSRAIWFAFTRAKLPYNDTDGYLNTADMSALNSRMRNQFDPCDEPLRLGDIVVYRDAGRGDGHAVMVIDPVKRIAWGSHGWDGNVKELEVSPQTGIEYQRIKYKPDWLRWDRPTMEKTACWRYRQFATEAQAGRGLPGTKWLDAGLVCDPANCTASGALMHPPAPEAPEVDQ